MKRYIDELVNKEAQITKKIEKYTKIIAAERVRLKIIQEKIKMYNDELIVKNLTEEKEIIEKIIEKLIKELDLNRHLSE